MNFKIFRADGGNFSKEYEAVLTKFNAVYDKDGIYSRAVVHLEKVEDLVTLKKELGESLIMTKEDTFIIYDRAIER